MVKIFYERDAKPEALKGKTIAILGYGSQGHAQAQNLRDSGHKVIIGLDPNRPSAQQARADGMVVVAPDEAAKRSDWIHVLTPDETQAQVYEQSIKAYLHPGKVLGVSHGFSIHFKTGLYRDAQHDPPWTIYVDDYRKDQCLDSGCE